MILDQVENIGRYRGLIKNLDTLIDWMGTNNYKELEVGRHDIDGDRVYANVMNAETHEVADGHFEWHRDYIDVQVDCSGRESFRVTNGKTVEIQSYDEKDDYGLVDASQDDADGIVAGDLDHDRFVIYMAGEPHMPTCTYEEDGKQPLKKICFKVAVK